MYNTIIFDLDGTILNTTNGIIESVQYALNKLNLNSLEKSDYENFIACSPLKKSFQKYCNLDSDTADKCCLLYKKYYAKYAQNNTKIYDGIIELLEYLKIKNYKIGIATYKDEVNAKKIVSWFKLDKYFNIIRGADNKNKLPKTEILADCIKKLDSKYEDCYFIGDTRSDAIAAQDLCINFIAVTYGFGFKTKEDCKTYNPIMVAKSVTEIKDFLTSNNNIKSAINI